MLIQNFKDEQVGYEKFLIAGLSGVGKTTCAGTIPGKVLMVQAEQGGRPLKGRDIHVIDISVHDTEKDDFGRPKTMTSPADRLAKLSRTFKWCHAGCLDPKTNKPLGISTIVVDSVTEIAELVEQDQMSKFPDRKDSFPMWGEIAKINRSIVKGFRDLPFNIVMTVLTEWDKDETGKRFMGFDVSGKIGKKLPQYFDYVFYLHADAEGSRSFITRSTDTLICKDRSGKLDPKEPVDFHVVFSKINSREGEKK
jgi:hypothetical protein